MSCLAGWWWKPAISITDTRVPQELDVDHPTDQAGQRAQLAAAVARLLRGAHAVFRQWGGVFPRLRGHLVVAHYAEAPGPRSALSVPEASADVQQPLFVG
jgi:hypothetical protein